MENGIQIIERDGEPEYAVVPIETYRRLLERAEEAADVRAFDEALAAVANGEDEVVPAEVARRLLSGEETPVRVWREYRGLTQAELAAMAGVGKSYLSQVERGSKAGSLRLMRRLATALGVDMEDLVPPEG
jgi:DNA-binding XRE family transcriptional regulator